MKQPVRLLADNLTDSSFFPPIHVMFIFKKDKKYISAGILILSNESNENKGESKSKQCPEEIIIEMNLIF